jgi:hypothetical protein
MQWIEIPDLKSQGLSLSSLLTGMQVVEQAQKVSDTRATEPQVQFSVSQRFKRSSRLGFLVFIYNATRNGGAADLTGLALILNAQGQALIETPARPLMLDSAADPARLPYAGALPLQSLAPNQYVLRVVITDRTTKTSATQQLSFTVE